MSALPDARHVRNPTGQTHLQTGDWIVSLADDEAAETLRVLTGPVYDLKASPVVTLARKAAEADRRAEAFADVETLRLALEADATLGGVVEDARLQAVESADLDRARWMAGGLDLTIRLLFAAPSPAG